MVKIKKDINTIYNVLDALLEYLDTANQVTKALQAKGISKKIVQAFALAWQYGRNTSRNRVNQELLNLIMFYHNHRRYKSGKRKGKTPAELLTGKKQQKQWLEMLMEKVEKGEICKKAA